MKDHETKDSFVPDSRFRLLWRDAKETMVGWWIYFAVLMLICIFVGGGDPANYTYVMGFPLWYFLCLAVSLVVAILHILQMSKRCADVSLDADDPNFDYEKNEVKTDGDQ